MALKYKNIKRLLYKEDSYNIIIHLYNNDYASMLNLYKDTGLNQNTAEYALDQLIDKGLIVEDIRSGFRVNKYYKLTDKGKDVAEHLTYIGKLLSGENKHHKSAYEGIGQFLGKPLEDPPLPSSPSSVLDKMHIPVYKRVIHQIEDLSQSIDNIPVECLDKLDLRDIVFLDDVQINVLNDYLNNLLRKSQSNNKCKWDEQSLLSLRNFIIWSTGLVNNPEWELNR